MLLAITTTNTISERRQK